MGYARAYLYEKTGASKKVDGKEFIGIGGYIAGVRTKEDITMTSSVTTNTVESGTSINDHIINNPIILNIEGEVGDLEKMPDPVLQAYKKVPKNVGVVSKYLPKRTVGQLSKINSYALKANDLLNKLDSAIDDGMQIYKLFKPLDTKKETEKFFIHFDKIYNTKQLIEIETRIKTYKNMRLISFTVTNDGGNYLSYKMTFQEVVFAMVKVSKNNDIVKKKSSKTTKMQTKEQKDKGTVKTEQVPEAKQSLLKKMLG